MSIYQIWIRGTYINLKIFPIVLSERSPCLPLHQVHALPRGQARHPGEVGQARGTQDQDLRFHPQPGETDQHVNHELQ